MTNKHETNIYRLPWLLIILVVLLTPSICQARLSPTAFSQLVLNSDLILIGAPINIQRRPHYAGVARLKVLQVIYGKYEKSEISISWSSGVHDQPLDSLKVRLLFLRKNSDASYTGTLYGRSYWPFFSRVIDFERVNLDSKSLGFCYKYPLTKLLFTQKQESSLLEKVDHFCETDIPFIRYIKLKSYLLEIIHSK